MDVLEFMNKGGFFMWVLAACSVFGVAAILERSVYHWRARFDVQKWLKQLKEFISEGGKISQAEVPCSDRSPVAKLASVYLNYLASPLRIRDEALKREGNLLLDEADTHLKLLSSLGSVSPLIGLLGTVVGLVEAFQAIQSGGGIVDPTIVAGGIWVALLTTVFGLCVGIPCFLFAQYFLSRFNKISREMELVVSELDEIFSLSAAEEAFSLEHKDLQAVSNYGSGL